MGVSKNYLIACYGNGLVSILNIDTGSKLADITAHARWINCLDVFGNKFITAGEDCYLRVWELTEINNQMKVIPVHSEHVVDCFITGVQFNKKTEEICVTCYDNNDIIIYRMQ